MHTLLNAFLEPTGSDCPSAFHRALAQGWLNAKAEGRRYDHPDVFLRDVLLSRLRDAEAAFFLSAPLIAYLNEPAAVKSVFPLTRLMALLYDALGENKKQFDLATPEGCLRFYHAFITNLAVDYCLPSELVPEALYALLKKAGATVNPPPGARCTLVREGDFKKSFTPAADAPAITVIGPANLENGLGQGLRYMADGLIAAGVSFSILNKYGASRIRASESRLRQYEISEARAPVNVIHFNSDMLAENMLAANIGNFANRYNIGYFVWETAKLSEAHRLGADLVDEIWVPTEFMRELYAGITKKPVINMGSVVHLPKTEGNRADFGFKDEFVFLFTFDAASRQTRKNPMGAVQAFKQAFPSERDVKLVLKTQNGDKLTDPVEQKLFAELKKAVSADARIRLIDETYETACVAGLIKSSDAYISLHRCEGFGYGMAEAMVLGVPVIATGWSGNADFVRADTAWPIAYKLAPVKPSEYHYAQEGGHEWAEPDLASAAEAMRAVYGDRTAAKIHAAAGQVLMQRHYSAAAVGARMQSRLAELNASGFSGKLSA